MIRRLLIAAAASVLTAAASAAGSPLVAAGQKVAGQTQSQWTRAWWQWAASFEEDESPVADTTGERCGAGQQGAVWFLAGTYGTRRTIRACTVPAGKYLFFPLINYVVTRPAEYVVSCDTVTEQARELMEGATNLVLRVDGVVLTALDQQRVSSQGCFDLGKRQQPSIRMFPAAADGYYAMLKPLAPGRHTIEFGGALPDMVQAVSYTMDVR